MDGLDRRTSAYIGIHYGRQMIISLFLFFLVATEVPAQEATPTVSQPPPDAADGPVTFDDAVTTPEETEGIETDNASNMPEDAPLEVLDLPRNITIPERMRLGEEFLLLGETDQALSVWEDVPGESPSKLVIYDKALLAYRTEGQHWKAFKVLLLKQTILAEMPKMDAAAVDSVNGVRNDIVAVIETHLQESDLQRVVQESGAAFPADVALIRLMTLYEAQGDAYRVTQEIQRFTVAFPQHPALSQVEGIRERMRQRAKSLRYRIGALFQMTGDSAAFSDAALKGIQLALQQFPVAGGGVGLIVKALEGQTPEALEKWVKEDRPIALVGPLLSKEVNRVAPIAEAAGLVLITPGATAASLTSLGKSVVRNASTGRAQCHAIAQYAVSRMGLSHFAILSPRTHRSEAWTQCFSEQVKKRGGQVVSNETYSPEETDFSEPILRIKGASGTSVKPDAIFLPGNARTVGLLIPQLAFHGVRGLALLGTHDWNHPSFLKLVGGHAEGAVFADGFFLGSTDAAVLQFVESYQKKYQQTPDILAAQAYDATRLILSAIEAGAATPQAVRAAILSTTQHAGASGQILEMREGEAVKQPLMIEVRRGRFVQIE